MMKVFQLQIGKYNYHDFFQEITEHVLQKENKTGKSIFTPNPEICLKTLNDREFLEMLHQADYLTSDGIGLYLAYQINDFLQPHFSSHEKILGGVFREYFGGVWKKIGASLLLPYYIFNILFRKKFLYAKYGDRICGSDITKSLLEFSQEYKIKIAIIDPYYPNDLQKCESQRTFREKLSQKFPKLDFDFYIYSHENSDNIFNKIKKSEAIILFSTLGMKKQEVSIIRGMNECPNIKLGLGVGSSFDYHIGFQKRAPKIFRDVGFEWFYRIFTSPNKLQRLGRIYQALIVFPIKVIIYKK